jgi:hypothetical protein
MLVGLPYPIAAESVAVCGLHGKVYQYAHSAFFMNKYGEKWRCASTFSVSLPFHIFTTF